MLRPSLASCRRLTADARPFHRFFDIVQGISFSLRAMSFSIQPDSSHGDTPSQCAQLIDILLNPSFKQLEFFRAELAFQPADNVANHGSFLEFASAPQLFDHRVSV